MFSRVVHHCFIGTALALSSMGALATAAPGGNRPPNVVLILADDLGFSDTTLFGTTDLYRTPNIERLAARGMTFNRAYSASPLCSPTRAGILTGLHPARLGLTSPNCHLPQVVLKATAAKSGAPNQKSTTPTSVTRLDPKYQTLAETLKSSGYTTGHFGKWHLGIEPHSPLENGFDVDVPHWHGPGPKGSYVAPWSYLDFDPRSPKEHIEDRMASEAADFMEAHRDEPFFLNYWMFSVHAPFDAKQELIRKYRDLVEPDNPQRSPIYAAMIESMDDAVGTLLDTLDRLGLSDDTIIVFASDNGGNMYNDVEGTTATSNAPLRGGKATMYEGGIRGPAIVCVPGRVAAGSKSDAVVQSMDYYPTLLELLQIDPQPNQPFDGVSIVPALEGGELNREAIYTYFPHSPPVPQWIPPSVSIHRGEWKLIRIFHHGDNGNHRYQLFHLVDDIGETNDLSNERPDLVAELDAMIEAFLIDTKAVRPLPNPNFDPSQYDPSTEGVGRIRSSGKSPKPRAASPPVANWRAAGTNDLKFQDDQLIIRSTGSDPYITHALKRPLAAGKYTAAITLSSDASGFGQLFWQQQNTTPPYAADRSKKFDVRHDGNSQTVSVPFETGKPVIGLRIDPARDTGTISIADVIIRDANGRVAYRWSP